jgi:hypothetical protein
MLSYLLLPVWTRELRLHMEKAKRRVGNLLLWVEKIFPTYQRSLVVKHAFPAFLMPTLFVFGTRLVF